MIQLCIGLVLLSQDTSLSYRRFAYEIVMQFSSRKTVSFLVLCCASQLMRAFRQTAHSVQRLQRSATSSIPNSIVRPASTLSALVPRKFAARHRFFKLTALAAMASTTTIAAAAGKQQAPIEIFRSDYKPSDFYVSDIFMSFQLDTHESVVTTTSQLSRSISPSSKGADLILDGEDLDLLQIKIAGTVITAEHYTYEGGKLRIPSASFPVGAEDSFELETSVRLKPDQNLALSGLYKSGQCIKLHRHFGYDLIGDLHIFAVTFDHDVRYLQEWRKCQKDVI